MSGGDDYKIKVSSQDREVLPSILTQGFLGGQSLTFNMGGFFFDWHLEQSIDGLA